MRFAPMCWVVNWVLVKKMNCKYFFTLFASRLMRRALVLIIFILKVSRPLLSNHAIILDDLRWKNLIIMAQQQWLWQNSPSSPKGQKLQSHYVIMLARAERAKTKETKTRWQNQNWALRIKDSRSFFFIQTFWKRTIDGCVHVSSS